MISGGITKFSKANTRHSFRLRVKEALDYAVRDVPRLRREMIEGSATGLMQAVFEFWQLQGTIARHNNGDGKLEVKRKKKSRPTRGLIHFHAATEIYVTASIMETRAQAVVGPERSRSIEAAGALAPAVAHS